MLLRVEMFYVTTSCHGVLVVPVQQEIGKLRKCNGLFNELSLTQSVTSMVSLKRASRTRP